MKKRGQLVYKLLFVLIMVAITIIAFLSAGKTWGNGDIYYKAAIAKDLAMMINQLHVMPGDAEIIYPQDLSKHTLVIRDNTIKVSTTEFGIDEVTTAKHTFVGNPIDEVILKNPHPLIIRKTGTTIKFLQ